MMKTNPWKTSTLFLAAALGVIAISATISPAQAEPQGNMRDALTRIQEAKAALDRAADDKGGHRAKALGLLGQSISEVQQGIAYADSHH